MSNDLKEPTILVFHEVKEGKRVYTYGEGQVEVEGVERVAISESGNHRLEIQGGIKMIVKAGWLAITIYGAEEWSF